MHQNPATLPDVHLLLYTYQRKEAVLSSQIEGMQSTLDDLLAHELGEAPGVPLADVTEVSRYVAAMTHGLQRLRDGFPLSNRLLREMHAILLESGRGAEKTPGEFRKSQNWIGGARPGTAALVPPPPQEVERCMSDLERFLHSNTSALIKAALAHVQFETVHPFLDGNGRIGRLLVTLVLCHDGVLREPLLYSSLYFKQHRQQYYAELNGVRESGDFERWLEFFATAIRVSADAATVTGQRIFTVFREDRDRLKAIGRAAPYGFVNPGVAAVEAARNDCRAHSIHRAHYAHSDPSAARTGKARNCARDDREGARSCIRLCALFGCVECGERAYASRLSSAQPELCGRQWPSVDWSG